MPIFYDQRFEGCKAPAQSYGGHGFPVPTESIVVEIADSTGALVTNWKSRTAYTVTIRAYGDAPVNMWINVNTGTPALDCSAHPGHLLSDAIPLTTGQSTAQENLQEQPLPVSELAATRIAVAELCALAGLFNAPDPATGAVAAACKQSWYSLAPALTHTTEWQSASTPEDDCVKIVIVQAAGRADTYQTTEVRTLGSV